MDSIPLDTPQKQCVRCFKILPATEMYFSRDKSVKSGLRGKCKNCTRELYKAYSLAHKEERKAYRLAHRAEAIAYRKVYAKTYRPAHLAETHARQHAHYLAHKEQYRIKNRSRRAQMHGNSGTHSIADIQAQYKNQRGKCYYCKKKVGNKYDVDHVTPLSKGGSNGPENLVIACVSCNRSKSTKIVRLM